MCKFRVRVRQSKVNTVSPVLVLLAGLLSQAPCGAQSLADRVQLQFNTQQAEAVLAILNNRAEKDSVEESDWLRLFETEPYIRLKSREAGLGRSFTDAEFQRFVLADSLAARATILESRLRDWKSADLSAAAARAISYLPPEATIRAKVFPVIKPQTNSFVYELLTDPAIFLYLDPQLNAAQFENTVAHELHHVGYASFVERFSAAIADLPPRPHTAAAWMGTFGEGFAMLAAAGGPDIHPHAVSTPEDRARWDRDVAHFAQDLVRLDKFFLDIVDGSLATPDTIQQVAMSFMGVQGPWYTVGWRMAVLIEKHFGRATLISCMLDPRMLLSTYNSAALREGVAGEQLPQWSPELLHAIGARMPAVGSALPAALSGQTPVIDYHQHLFSPEAAALVTGDPRSPGISARDVIALLDSAGIRRALVLSVAYTWGKASREPIEDEYARVRAENDWTARQVAQHPDRLRGFCSFNPLKPYALEELERCSRDPLLNHGLKLHFGNSDVDLDNRENVARVRDIFARANGHGMAIVVHMRTSLDNQRQYGADQARVFLNELLPAAPDVPVQIAHLAGAGGYEAATDSALTVFADAIARRDALVKNVGFDATGVVRPGMSADVLQLIATRVRQIGVERVVYGSDAAASPLTYPKAGWEAFRRLPLTEAEFRVIADNIAPYARD